MFAVTPPHNPRATLVRNEGIKLTATYVNTVAASVFAIGGLAPVISVLYASVPVVSPFFVFAISTVCCLVSAVLHFAARRTLLKMVGP